jgi:hypothetical protein
MIVGTVFDGDDDNDTKWIQHDVYNDALRTIVTGCQRHYERATSLASISSKARPRAAEAVGTIAST